MSIPKISVTETPARAQGFGVGRVLKAGLLSILAAVGANLVVRLLLSAQAAQNPGFAPFNPVQIALLTTVFTFVGVLVFLVVSRFVKNPSQVYTVIALIGIGLSMIPNLALLSNPSAMAVPIGDPGTARDFGILIVFHIVGGLVHLLVFRALLKR